MDYHHGAQACMSWMPAPTPFEHLTPGARYEVVQPFTDFDGREHAVGEAWTYLTYSFLPYDDGLSLFATIDGVDQQVRMHWTQEDQGSVIDRLGDYLRAAGG